MKRILLIYIFAIFNYLSIQTADVKFPSLTELAAKQAAESVEIDSSLYEKLNFAAQQEILINKGTLAQVLNFINQHHDEVTQDLIASIPDRLWDDLLNGSTTIQSFIDQITNFSNSEKRWLQGAFTEKILSYLNQTCRNYYIFSTYNEFNYSRSTESRLPIEFELPSNSILLKITKQKIIYEFNYLLLRFIAQKIQDLFLKNLELKDLQIFKTPVWRGSSKQVIASNHLKGQILSLLEQLKPLNKINEDSYYSKLTRILDNLIWRYEIEGVMIYYTCLEK
jgi:hypothetical protein